jgi:hypothetical protein
MKESNINSKYSKSLNNLNLAVFKSSLRTNNNAEQAELDRNINELKIKVVRTV